MLIRYAIALWLVAAALTPLPAFGEVTDRQFSALEAKVARLQSQVSGNAGVGASFFLCGAFCALWAQHTGRNAWLWFFLGALFNVITVLVLLYKNSEEMSRRQ